jgi:hypothetical protein
MSGARGDAERQRVRPIPGGTGGKCGSVAVVMRATVLSRSIIAAALALACLGAAPVPAAAPSAPDADAIFANVRKTWGQGAYPRFAEYTTVVEYHKDGRHLKHSWETTEDFRHGAIYSKMFSREQLNYMGDPDYRINIGIPFFGNLTKPQPKDPIGHVAFAVDQDYGMAPVQRAFQTPPSQHDFNAQASKLQVIGRTGTTARDYEVRLIETLDGPDGKEYHLGLRPLRDPQRFRLREIYVDADTYRAEEAVVDGISNRAPLSKVPWRIEFREVAGATYIARETALQDLDYGRAGLLRWVTISFEELKLGSKPSRFGADLGLPNAGDDPLHEP